MNLLLALLLIAAPLEARPQDLVELSGKITARAFAELQSGKLFPQKPAAVWGDGEQRTISFWYGQSEAVDLLHFPKIVASIKYGPDPPYPEYVEEKQQGTHEFRIPASTFSVTVDTRFYGDPAGLTPPEEVARKYNLEKEEIRKRNAQGGASTSVVFQTVKTAKSRPWSEIMTTAQFHLYADYQERDYSGASGYVLAFRDTGLRAGYPTEYYNGLIHSIARGDLPMSIRARALLEHEGGTYRIEIYTAAHNIGWPDRVARVSEVDAAMNHVVRILRDELGLPALEVPTPPIVQPDVPEDPDVPEEVVLVPPIPVAIPEPIVRPDGPAGAPADRINAMIALLLPLETDLQAGLIQIKILSDRARVLRAKIAENRAFLAGNNKLNKGMLQEELDAWRQELAPLNKYLNRQIEMTFRLMDQTVESVEAIFDGGGFGELHNHAERVLRAARDRRDFLKGQIFIASGKYEALFAYARSLQGEVGGSAKAYFLEGMGLLHTNKPIAALQRFRDARGFGLRPGEGGAPATGSTVFNSVMSGEVVEDIQRALEIQYIEALQEQVTGGRARYERAFFAETDQRAELDHERGHIMTWLKRLFRTGVFATVENAGEILNEKIHGDSTFRAREEEIGVIGDEVAKTHMALGVIKGLRKAGFQLHDIKSMNENEFHDAVQVAWERKLDINKVEALRTVMMTHGFSNPNMRDFASGRDLTEPGALSAKMIGRIEDSPWANLRSFTGSAANMVDGWMLLTGFAPAAQVGVLGKVLGTPKATTLGEFFAGTQAVQKAVEKLSGNPMGRKALAGAERVQEFAEASEFQGARVFFYEAAGATGASYLAGKVGGEPGKIMYDMFSMTGADSPRFWAKAFGKFRVDPEQVEDAARILLRDTVAKKEVLESASDVTKRMRAGIEAAGEEGLDDAALAAFRREIQQLDSLPPAQSQRLSEALDDVVAGRRASALENLNSASRLSANDLARVNAAQSNAENFLAAAEEMPDELVEAATRKSLTDLDVDEAVTGQGVSAARTGEGVGDARTNPPTNQGVAGGAGDAGGEAKPVRGPPRRGRDRHFDGDEPSAPWYQGDRHIQNGEHDLAAAAYHQAQIGLPGDAASKRARRILDQKTRLSEAAGKADRTPIRDGANALDEADDAIMLTAIENVHNSDKVLEMMRGGKLPHLEGIPVPPRLHKIGKGKSGKSYVVTYETDPATGQLLYVNNQPVPRKVGVVYELETPAQLEEAWAEVLNSKVMQATGRFGPVSKIYDVQLANGQTRKWLGTKYEAGIDWDETPREIGNLLAHKEDLAQDLPYRMLGGDGDTHGGNYRFHEDKFLHGIDYAGGDILPSHPDYRDWKKMEQIGQRLGQYRTRLEEMVADPDSFGVDRDAVRHAAAELQRAAPVFKADPLDGDPLVSRSREEAVAELERLTKSFEDLGDGELTAAEIGDLYSEAWSKGRYFHPDAPGNPMTMDEQQFGKFVDGNMKAIYDHAVHQWGDSRRVVESAIVRKDFAAEVQKIQQELPAKLDQIIEDSMTGATQAQKDYVRRLFGERVERLGDFLNSKFPESPSTSFHWDGVPRRKAA